MGAPEQPSEANAYLADHVARLGNSFYHWTGRSLFDPRMTPQEAARYLFHAPFAVVSHDHRPDPVFNYGNQTALALFGMRWEEFTALPSRLSAERQERAARERLLAAVAERGYVDDYRGIRIARHGRRFLIERATVWNVLDAQSRPCGQAAYFTEWRWL
ncbi:MEKHLA domain-containing protein [Candidatus Methylocalor cossyra]|uniref:MEKHLA domain-containing protein n=1 Tax=Candidatus Methylocalor cossyra TaxID=3108543 RepID=A0ABP1C941_9GAMM